MVCVPLGQQLIWHIILSIMVNSRRFDNYLYALILGGYCVVRVDYGVENTAVCDAMVAAREEGRGSFIAGSSTRNQRIERLWRDVFRCICHIFYYTFYAMEQTGLLDVENPVHMFTLQYIYLRRINCALSEWMVSFNDHPVQTEHNWSPNQMWLNGMMNPCNPLAVGNLDDNPEDITFYGEDPEGANTP